MRDGRLVAVESVETLQARAMREVTIRFAAGIDEAPFRSLPGVRDVSVHDAILHCHLTGSADQLVKLAARHEVLDFTSAPPDLETLLLHYYSDEGAGDGDVDR